MFAEAITRLADIGAAKARLLTEKPLLDPLWVGVFVHEHGREGCG
jgi:hypothetical protein